MGAARGGRLRRAPAPESNSQRSVQSGRKTCSSFELLGATLPLCRARVSPAKLFRPAELTRPFKRSGFHHRHLRDVDRAAAEATLTIHQVIAPEVVEGFLETGKRSTGDSLVVAISPPLQRFRIVETEAGAILPRQAPRNRQACERRFVEQHPTREDVGLDEVGILRVTIEDPVIDTDELKRGDAAGLQVPRDAVEIGAPPATADGFNHLHGRYSVEVLRRVAIVLKSYLDPIGEAGIGNLPLH